MGDCVNSEGDLSGHNSWKHGHEAAGGTKALNQSSGSMDGCSFVDTVVGGAALVQYLREAHGKERKLRRGKVAFSPVPDPLSWDFSVAEG